MRIGPGPGPGCGGTRPVPTRGAPVRNLVHSSCTIPTAAFEDPISEGLRDRTSAECPPRFPKSQYSIPPLLSSLLFFPPSSPSIFPALPIPPPASSLNGASLPLTLFSIHPNPLSHLPPLRALKNSVGLLLCVGRHARLLNAKLSRRPPHPSSLHTRPITFLSPSPSEKNYHSLSLTNAVLLPLSEPAPSVSLCHSFRLLFSSLPPQST